MGTKPKPTTPAIQSDTVTVRCTSKRAGKIGTTAKPLRKDLTAWINAGWEEVKEATPAE